jgi:hypothetical protein
MLDRQSGRIAVLAPRAPSLLGIWLVLTSLILPSVVAAAELVPSIERRVAPRPATSSAVDQPNSEEPAGAYWDMIAQMRQIS